MKKLVLLSVFAAASGVGMAQEVGRVISSTPVISQVAVPRQVCSNQQVATPGQKSGVGAIMGGIAGGALGSNVGGGDGRALATAIGLIGGAMLGDRMEGGGQPQTQNVQSCTTQTFYENRATAYNVVYEFNGKQYTVQMPQDPGPTVRLQVTPVGGPAAPQSGVTTQIQQDIGQPMPAQPVSVQPAPPQPVAVQPVYTQPVYTQPQTVITTTQYVTPPVVVAAAPAVVYAYPGYYRPYYPVGVNLNLGWRGGHRHWR